MRVLCIIAECNPLHNGHIDLVRRAKERTGAGYCIVLMSGDYVQRGAPACIGKYTRAGALLKNGADVVIELPLYTALSSADGFAKGAVALADSLGVVTDLCFGSECADMEKLDRSASALLEPGTEFGALVREKITAGASYPEAVSYAASQSGIWMPDTPNDILGLQYLTALKERASGITAHAMERIKAPSASDLRGFYTAPERIRREVPPDTAMLSCFKDVYGPVPAVSENDFSDFLLYKLREEMFRNTELTRYYDVSRELAGRIRNSLPAFTSFTDLADMLKCRNYTYTRISRMLMHIILGMTDDEADRLKASGYVAYIHILGMRSAAAPLVKEIRNASDLPVVTGSKRSYDLLDPGQKAVMDREMAAADLYEAVLFKKTAQNRNGTERMPQQWTRRFLTVHDEV